MISSGILWLIAYILIIKRGFQDKIYGMPMVALCANLSWEFIFTVIYPHHMPQLTVNCLWLLFDLVILFQFLKFGKKEIPEFLDKKFFFPLLAISLLVAFCGIMAITTEFTDFDGKYAAFGQNLLMSILFIHMLAKRKSLQGQSLYIGIFKFTGTLMASLQFYLWYPTSVLLIFFYITIILFDILYIVLILYLAKKENINIIKRF